MSFVASSKGLKKLYFHSPQNLVIYHFVASSVGFLKNSISFFHIVHKECSLCYRFRNARPPRHQPRIDLPLLNIILSLFASHCSSLCLVCHKVYHMFQEALCSHCVPTSIRPAYKVNIRTPALFLKLIL